MVAPLVLRGATPDCREGVLNAPSAVPTQVEAMEHVFGPATLSDDQVSLRVCRMKVAVSAVIHPRTPGSSSPHTLRLRMEEHFFRFAASGLIPAQRYLPKLPAAADMPARTGRLAIEIVSHCWNYAHLLAYQLSSLVLHAPTKLNVRMTVFYCPEDEATVRLLRFFEGKEPPGVTWNWRPLERPQLLRRAIGRNRAALATTADWVWFTDCDVLFHRDCLDSLAQQLQGRSDLLLYPKTEYCTHMLAESDPMLQRGGAPGLREIDPSRFSPLSHDKATGPLQITHGDIARQTGYCNAIGVYQQPALRWRKTYEDRAFRWLLRTQGNPIDIPGLHRIKHVEKGRYHQSRMVTVIRQSVRRAQAWMRRRNAIPATVPPATPGIDTPPSNVHPIQER